MGNVPADVGTPGDDAPAEDCTCLGLCVPGAHAGPPAATGVVAQNVPQGAIRAGGAPAGRALPGTPATYRLPPATGPPSLS